MNEKEFDFNIDDLPNFEKFLGKNDNEPLTDSISVNTTDVDEVAQRTIREYLDYHTKMGHIPNGMDKENV